MANEKLLLEVYASGEAQYQRVYKLRVFNGNDYTTLSPVLMEIRFNQLDYDARSAAEKAVFDAETLTEIITHVAYEAPITHT